MMLRWEVHVQGRVCLCAVTQRHSPTALRGNSRPCNTLILRNNKLQ